MVYQLSAQYAETARPFRRVKWRGSEQLIKAISSAENTDGTGKYLGKYQQKRHSATLGKKQSNVWPVHCTIIDLFVCFVKSYSWQERSKIRKNIKIK